MSTDATGAAAPAAAVAPAAAEPVVAAAAPPAAKPATTKPEPTVVGKPEKMIPKHRLDEVSGKLSTAEAELATLREKAAKADTFEAQATTLTTQLAFARVGIVDDDHVDAVSAAYAKLPADDTRPASVTDYWAKIQAGELTAPRTLLGFLTAAPAAAADPGAAGAPAAPPRPKLPTAAPSPAPAGPTVTVDQVKAAQAQFKAAPTKENLAAMTDLQDRLRESLKKPS